MMNTIEALYHFNMSYLLRLVENISDEQLYEKQLEGLNSAGWILGHLFVEGQDILDFYKIEHTTSPEWNQYFRYGSGKITSLENLPKKEEMIDKIKVRYQLLLEVYLNLSKEQREAKHPSQLLAKTYQNMDAWFAHHFTNHIAIHCGNITVWKKMIGIPINGY